MKLTRILETRLNATPGDKAKCDSKPAKQKKPNYKNKHGPNIF